MAAQLVAIQTANQEHRGERLTRDEIPLPGTFGEFYEMDCTVMAKTEEIDKM
jgi:hypothetical protein